MIVFVGTSFIALTISLFAMWMSLRIPGRFDIIESYVWLEQTFNPGIAFGYRIPSPWQERLIFAALALVVIAAYLERESKSRQFAYGLIAGGAIANIIDRILDGYVTDIFHVLGFPAFNMADTSITLGVLLLLAYVFRDE